MGFGRWFGAAIGWMVSGPMGALLGYIIGKMFEGDETPRIESDNTSRRTSTGTGRSRSRTQEDVIAAAARDNFLFSLLVLSACVIKADGKVMHSEMEYVRNYFRQNMGEDSVAQIDDILKNLFQKDIDWAACSVQIAQNMERSQRLLILDYLVGIAKADGKLPTEEITMLRQIAAALGLSTSEVDSMLNLGGQTKTSAYKVLEIEPSATDDEVRKAYKQLVLKHHPDRVANLGEDIRKKAEEKLKQINEAYEIIKKERGMK